MSKAGDGSPPPKDDDDGGSKNGAEFWSGGSPFVIAAKRAPSKAFRIEEAPVLAQEIHRQSKSHTPSMAVGGEAGRQSKGVVPRSSRGGNPSGETGSFRAAMMKAQGTSSPGDSSPRSLSSKSRRYPTRVSQRSKREVELVDVDGADSRSSNAVSSSLDISAVIRSSSNGAMISQRSSAARSSGVLQDKDSPSHISSRDKTGSSSPDRRHSGKLKSKRKTQQEKEEDAAREAASAVEAQNKVASAANQGLPQRTPGRMSSSRSLSSGRKKTRSARNIANSEKDSERNNAESDDFFDESGLAQERRMKADNVLAKWGKGKDNESSKRKIGSGDTDRTGSTGSMGRSRALKDKMKRWKKNAHNQHLERGAGEIMDKTYRDWLYHTIVDTKLQVPQPVVFEMGREVLPILELTKSHYEKSLGKTHNLVLEADACVKDLMAYLSIKDDTPIVTVEIPEKTMLGQIKQVTVRKFSNLSSLNRSSFLGMGNASEAPSAGRR